MEVKNMATSPRIAPTPIQPNQTPNVENVLAFPTQVGAVAIPGGQTKLLGVVDVSMYDRIRLVTDERIDSTSNIILRLTFTEGEELVAQLDTIMLTPHSQLTRVYDLPGTRLSVYADSVGPAGTKASVDVLIYGQY
jgi:type III secretion protein HrpB1